MLEQALVQLLLLLGATVLVVLVFQRFRIPPSLGYLLVGVMLGAHTAGPVIDNDYIDVIAEFGIVFLLFTIGLSFSLPQIYALRHTILGLGTAQVALTTLVVAMIAWWLGLPGPAAFVVGAVFAQSSTSIISKQLLEQGESQARHGRLGTTMSVFQDITAVPFVVIIPVLGVAAMHEVAGALGMALAKAFLAFVIVLLSGRYLLRPLFHLVAERRSAELFTLTVLFVSLVSAWTTKTLGLSMAFGAFLAGMVLGDTEFRHQVESTIRPFRDVLLGLFFVSIGMLVEPALLPDIWLEALLGALGLLGIKVVLVTLIVRFSGVDPQTAFRTGLVLAVGGEFGFALLAIGLDGNIIASRPAQIVLNSVLFSMILAPLLIRFNQPLALWAFGRSRGRAKPSGDVPTPSEPTESQGHVVICGFGRTGQTVSRFLESEGFDYLALDMDPAIVREARLAGQQVFYGDSSDLTVLENVGVERAALLVISHDDRPAALTTLRNAKRLNPELAAVVRTRDQQHVEELRKAGATEVIPETLEASMLLTSHALQSLGVPLYRVALRLQEQRSSHYRMLRELFRGTLDSIKPEALEQERLHSVLMSEGSPAIGQSLSELDTERDDVSVTALVRDDKRERYPGGATEVQINDVLVLLGSQDNLERVERRLTGSGQPPE
ncbi:sodium:proton exchanger [Halomonas daqingensis]|uniref:Sodium:proton exchanger n=1 Tax=Billgrantia desiderata TaxID=52021 RepID=A0ABS9B698_9GAMM|nr:monovalent cation:proton antiporter family protein [Halomonas desiderata]MCE8043171.1 sodium:proton exchanger [Halomonas desiderata]MCE8047732.1 sodium:proton exchanger [Halomonas desiderata]